MNRNLARAGLAALAALLVGIAVGWGSAVLYRSGRSTSPSRLEAAMGKLGLTPEQRASLVALHEEREKGLAESERRIARARIELARLLGEEKWDRKRIAAAARAVGDLQGKRQAELIDHLSRVRETLTPAQREEFFACLCEEICRGCQAACAGGECICGGCITRGK